MKNYKETILGEEIIPGDEGYLPHEKDSDNQCSDMTKGYACTRTNGHEVPHAAHGGSSQQYATWED